MQTELKAVVEVSVDDHQKRTSLPIFKLAQQQPPGGGRLHKTLRHLDSPHQPACGQRLALLRHVRIMKNAGAVQSQNRGREGRDLLIDAPQPIPSWSPVAELDRKSTR